MKKNKRSGQNPELNSQTTSMKSMLSERGRTKSSEEKMNRRKQKPADYTEDDGEPPESKADHIVLKEPLVPEARYRKRSSKGKTKTQFLSFSFFLVKDLLW